MVLPTIASESEENSIIRRIQNGETEYFPLLTSRYQPVINYYLSALNCTEIDREDLFQEGLMALYSAVGVYDFSSASFSTFASVCIKRGIISAIRHLSNKKHIPHSLIVSVDEVNIDAENNPEDKFIDKENFSHFFDKIKLSLSSFEYNVLTAYLKYGNYSEVADTLSVSVKDVNNALHRARKKIRKINR